jgi:hypothetical protein
MDQTALTEAYCRDLGYTMALSSTVRSISLRGCRISDHMLDRFFVGLTTAREILRGDIVIQAFLFYF